MCCPKDSAGADCSGGLPSNQIECVYVHGPVAPSSDVDISQRKKEKGELKKKDGYQPKKHP
jgi:hypothetical protein